MSKNLIMAMVVNLSQLYFIGLMGFVLQIEWNYIAILMLTFFVSRFAFKQAWHYKLWYMCTIWSASLFMTLFFLFHADIHVSLLATIFAAYVVSGKGSIWDAFMYKKRIYSKYSDVEKFIKDNYDDVRIARYEEYVKKQRPVVDYKVYDMWFRKGMSQDEITKSLDIHQDKMHKILSEHCSALRYNLMIED